MYIAKICLNSVPGPGGPINFILVADIKTTPYKWGTRRLLWQHWFPSNRRRNLHFMIEYIKIAKAYELQNRHISSRCGPGHVTHFGESRSKI